MIRRNSGALPDLRARDRNRLVTARCKTWLRVCRFSHDSDAETASHTAVSEEFPSPASRLLDETGQAVPVTADQPFDDLLAANRGYADTFALQGFDGVARAGVAMVTCMDSRIDPLRMVGLKPGDAKIFRNPGARVTDAALEAIVLGVHLLNVNRVLVIPHTRCAVASNTPAELRDMVSASAGQDVSWYPFHVVEDQDATLREDIRRIRTHPLVPGDVAIGGFIYDVDSGLLDQRI